MSQVFVCRCGRRTTEPYIIGNERLCVVCAEFEEPEAVNRRERANWKRYQEESGYRVQYKERYGIH